MRRLPAIVSLALCLSCYNGSAGPISEISGTWGGENAGLIASDSSTHVHIGCTLGDTKARITVDAQGRFEAEGTYNVDAFPVDRGILHPARFAGQVSGTELTIVVTLTDTGQQLGPVRLIKGKEPKMGPCPICR